MNQNQWNQPTTDNRAYKRAGGRRAYNASRKMEQRARQRKVKVLALRGFSKAEIARRLGVHRSTIGRDIESNPALAAMLSTIEGIEQLSNPDWIKRRASELKQQIISEQTASISMQQRG